MKMKAYSVTVQATMSVVSHTKHEAVRIAKRAVAACPDLMSCYYIGEGYFSFDTLEEDPAPIKPLAPEKLSQGPSADDQEVPF